jgi:uncharacterized protein DUF1707
MVRVEGAPDRPERPAVRPQDLRAGTADRERVLDRLRHAHVEGRLDAEEFDERITATFAARTYGELDALTADLPPAPAAPPAAAAGVECDQRAEFRSGVAAWVAASALTTAIWVVSCIASGTLAHPWFLWVAGPWGVVLLVGWLGMRLNER